MIANLLYALALMVASPLIAYRMIRHGRYRRGVHDKLFGLSATRARQRSRGQRTIWLHGVSVGEVNLLAGLVSEIRSQAPDQPFVVSTSTDTGYDLAVQTFGAERVFFCPLDFSWAVRRTIRNLRPRQLVLAELELWPNLIRCAQQNSVPVKVMNGRLSQTSADRYQRFSCLTRSMFERLAWVGCQDTDSRNQFAKCGVPTDRLSVTGSIKFDSAPSSRETIDVQSRLNWSGANPWHRVWVVGSTQSGEEQMAIQIYNHLRVDHPELRLILVPRHRERFDDVAALVKQSNLRLHRRSTDESLFDAGWDDDTVILIDTIGELRHWWGVGQIATVGGSFGDRGGQNMLEPAGYGCAVSFGPDTRNFREIADQLIRQGGAVRTATASDLTQFVRRCLTDIPAADSLGRSARRWIAQHRGATEQTVRAILDIEREWDQRKAA